MENLYRTAAGGGGGGKVNGGSGSKGRRSNRPVLAVQNGRTGEEWQEKGVMVAAPTRTAVRQKRNRGNRRKVAGVRSVPHGSGIHRCVCVV